MVGKKQKEKKLAVGRAHYCSHPSRDDESWARALAAPLTKIPFKGGKSQPWDDVVGYEDLLDIRLSSIIRTVILRHFSLSLMRNSNGNDVMKANVTWCQYWFSPHKDIFVSQDLFFLTVVQALHHIFIFIPIVISLFYSKKYLHIYCYEASLLQSTFLVAQWWKKKKSTCQYRRCRFNLCVKKVPWRRKWQPIPVLLPGKSMDRRAWQATVYRVPKSWTWFNN